MAKALTDDALLKKLNKWRGTWVRSDSKAKAANLAAGAEKKKTRDGVLAEVKRAGIPVAAFKAEMTMLDHADKARTHRDKIVQKAERDDASEADQEVLLAFDRLTVLDESTLPLFEAATKAEIERNAKEAATPEDDEPTPEDDGKVVSMVDPETRAMSPQ